VSVILAVIALGPLGIRRAGSNTWLVIYSGVCRVGHFLKLCVCCDELRFTVYRFQGRVHCSGAYHPKATVCIADTGEFNLLDTDRVFRLNFFQKKTNL
jgi:hypothetical protein